MKPAKSAKLAPEKAPKAAAEPAAKAARKAAAKAPATTKKQALASKAKPPVAAKTASGKGAGAAVAGTSKDNKDSKAKKPKLVRDSFTIPKDEYAVIETLKQRCATLAQPVKKSELLRAGLKLLGAMSDASLRAAIQAVPSIKTGRPKAEEAPAAGASKTAGKVSHK